MMKKNNPRLEKYMEDSCYEEYSSSFSTNLASDDEKCYSIPIKGHQLEMPIMINVSYEEDGFFEEEYEINNFDHLDIESDTDESLSEKVAEDYSLTEASSSSLLNVIKGSVYEEYSEDDTQSEFQMQITKYCGADKFLRDNDNFIPHKSYSSNDDLTINDTDSESYDNTYPNTKQHKINRYAILPIRDYKKSKIRKLPNKCCPLKEVNVQNMVGKIHLLRKKRDLTDSNVIINNESPSFSPMRKYDQEIKHDFTIRRGVIVNANSSALSNSSLGSLCETEDTDDEKSSVYSKNGDDVELTLQTGIHRWVNGSMCTIGSKLTGDIKYCHQIMDFKSDNDLYRYVIDPWGQHPCAADGCQVIRVSGQIFCISHICAKCIQLGYVSEIATDDPPRNFCALHNLCCKSGCLKSCVLNGTVCKDHNILLKKEDKSCKKELCSKKSKTLFLDLDFDNEKQDILSSKCKIIHSEQKIGYNISEKEKSESKGINNFEKGFRYPGFDIDNTASTTCNFSRKNRPDCMILYPNNSSKKKYSQHNKNMDSADIMKSYPWDLIEALLNLVKLGVVNTGKERIKERISSRVYGNKFVIGSILVHCISRLEAIISNKSLTLIEESHAIIEKMEKIGLHLQLHPSIKRYFFELVNKINETLFHILHQVNHYDGFSIDAYCSSLWNSFRMDNEHVKDQYILLGNVVSETKFSCDNENKEIWKTYNYNEEPSGNNDGSDCVKTEDGKIEESFQNTNKYTKHETVGSVISNLGTVIF